MCNGGLESLNNMMSFHFPVLEAEDLTARASEGENTTQQHQEIQTSLQTIAQVNTQMFIKNLPTSKSPGPDGITNKALKQLPANVITHINKIFQKCIELSHIPKKWLESRAVFIPKPTKKNGTTPKATDLFVSQTLFSKSLKNTSN